MVNFLFLLLLVAVPLQTVQFMLFVFAFQVFTFNSSVFGLQRQNALASEIVLC